MRSRMLLKDADPKAYDAMLGLEKYLAQSSLQKQHAELIKIRVSQINGCAYCIDKHTRDAVAAGEEPRRIFLLNAWRETALFSPEERALLALTEEMTLIHRRGVLDDVYDEAIRLLGQQYTTEVMMAIIAMNAWNRVGITTGRMAE